MMLLSSAAGVSVTPAVQHGHQAHFPVFLLRIILRLHHSVGKNHQPVAALQSHRARLVRNIFHDAERHASGFQTLNGSRRGGAASDCCVRH